MRVRDYAADKSTRAAALTEAPRRIWINEHTIRSTPSKQRSRYEKSSQILASVLSSQKSLL